MTELDETKRGATSGHYRAPDRLTRRVLNPLVAWSTRRGLSLAGSRILEVRGRATGTWRSTPVNPFEVDGEQYLLAPRGDTQWARNLRVAGAGRLTVGRRTADFTAAEVDDAGKPRLLRAYLRRWRWESGVFFEGVGPDASDDELLAIAHRHPVFRIDVLR